MTTNQVLAVLGFMVPSVTAILVAYWHRKTIRQIELYRQNPAAGLKSPDSPLVAWFKRYRDLFVGAGLPSAMLVTKMVWPEPLTVASVIVIAACVGAVVFSISTHLLRRTLSVMRDMVDLLDALTSTSKDSSAANSTVPADAAKGPPRG